MFAGTGGSGVKKMPSKHSEIMPKKCVTCHMYREKEDKTLKEDRALKDKVLKEGGHTFRPDLRACLKCHEEPESLIAEQKAKTSPLLEELKGLLDKAPDKTSKIYKAALRNYNIVIADGGMGNHNPTYAQALLQHSISSLKFESINEP